MAEEKKPVKLRRRRIIQPGDRIAIGAELDAVTWREFRAHCVLEGITAGEVLDKLMQDYLKKEKQKRRRRRSRKEG